MPEDPLNRIQHLLGAFKGQLLRVSLDDTQDDYEARPELMNAAFSLSMFVNQFHCSGPTSVEINRLTYKLIIEKPMDLTKNRNFLGNTITVKKIDEIFLIILLSP